MKCLLCSSAFTNEKELFDHYTSFHKIDDSNWFFKKLFNLKNSKILKKCLRCDQFIVDRKAKADHDFLQHNEGKNQQFDDKPLDIKTLREHITIYSIDYHKHKNNYNFFDSEKCVLDFSSNCKYKFINSSNQKTFKCSFVIQNKQDPPLPHMTPMFDTRYWSMSLHEGVYFNDFIFFGIRHEILNRVILNGLSGSAWYFTKLVSISLKVLEDNIEFS